MSEARALTFWDVEPPQPVADVPIKGAWDVPSAEAGEKMIGVRAHQQARLLEWLAINGPATDEEIAAGACIGPNSIRPRLAEVRELGLARVVDQAGVTTAGNKARRWVVIT